MHMELKGDFGPRDLLYDNDTRLSLHLILSSRFLKVTKCKVGAGEFTAKKKKRRGVLKDLDVA